MALSDCIDPSRVPLRFGRYVRAIPFVVVGVLVASLLSSVALAAFDEGVAAYQSGDLPLAAKEFREAAEAGDAEAQFNLALMYEHGMGVGKDEKESVAWYQRSAKQGNSNAQYNLAVMYEKGRGCAVDFAQANHWYREAALRGDGLAIGNLGMLYMRAEGVKQDKVAALALLLISATVDASPENTAKRNISSTPGLNPELIAAAQELATEMSNAPNVLIPLDQHLKETASMDAGTMN